MGKEKAVLPKKFRLPPKKRMSRFKPRLAVKVEEEERRERQDVSLREQFEQEEGQVVYVESWPEKAFRLLLLIISVALAVLGIIALILPETRVLIVEILLKFVEEALGAVKIS